MGIGASIFLLAAGAILAFAVDADLSGIDLAVVGYILMAAGAIGLVLTMLMMRDRSPSGRVVEDRTITRDGDVY